MPRYYLPALRGRFGDWAYYSCLMPLRELAARVSLAGDIHTSKALSDLIQRELKEGRSRDIARYLREHDDRFFNSLVVAVYGGDPAWHQLDELIAKGHGLDVEAVSDDAVASIGFLSFTGDEKLFALDGQHRLAGIQLAISDEPDLGEDEASVIFVSHRTDAAGMTRTRGLFTTLNKTAKPVNKGEVIALDEADVMAIVVRDFVERHPRFSENRILVVANANLPANEDAHLTTIVNLYDVLAILFSRVMQVTPIAELQFNRPDDDALTSYRDFALRYFALLGSAFPELGEYFDSLEPATIVRKYRHPDGGSVLFRPVGLTMFTHVVEELARGRTLEQAVALVRRLPTDLAKPPYAGLLWNPAARTLDLRRQVLVRRLLLYMAGATTGAQKLEKLRRDVAKARAVQVEEVELPARVDVM